MSLTHPDNNFNSGMSILLMKNPLFFGFRTATFQKRKNKFTAVFQLKNFLYWYNDL
jgi:hypothetical protein